MDDLLIPLARREVMAELPAESRVEAVVPVLLGFMAPELRRGVGNGGSAVVKLWAHARTY